jgi:hypothetical protein
MKINTHNERICIFSDIPAFSETLTGKIEVFLKFDKIHVYFHENRYTFIIIC